MRHSISLYKPYVILFILSQITLCIKAEKVSINDNLKHLEDSLCQILDTMPHDLRYIKHISTIELMLIEQALLTAKQMYEEAKKYKSLDGLVAANMSIGQAMLKAKRYDEVLFNFINNAIKFTADGYIHIGYKLNKEEKTVSIFVEDTGRGIPEEHQKKIFDRFYKQVDTDQGTGLGLSICSIIAEKQGGYLTLVSEVGKGSCFTIILPYDETINQY